MGHTHGCASAAIALICNGLACITLTKKKVCVRRGKHHESRTSKVPLETAVQFWFINVEVHLQ